MPSFDIVSEINEVEIRNAEEQANKEISTRFDFKDSDARVEYADKMLTVFADDNFKIKQVNDILNAKLSKRGVDLRCLEQEKEEAVSGGKIKQKIKVKSGIAADLAKQIVKIIKDSKIKVQTSIQGDSVRVSGNKRDDLQEVIALIKKSITSFPVQFNNFRE